MSSRRYSTRGAVVVEEQVHDPADGEVRDALQDAGVRPGEAHRPDVEGDHERDHEQPDRESVEVVVVGAEGDVVEVGREAGEGDQGHVADEEQDEGDHHEEVDRACDLAVAEQARVPAEAVVEGGRHRQAGEDRQRREDEDDREVGELLQRVVAEEAARAAGEDAGSDR